MNALNKHQSIFIAAATVLLLASWFTPASTSADFTQVDFWLLWLVAMTFLALPMLYLEVALAKRSKKTPVAGLPELTRQADAGTYWRVASWLGVVLMLLFAVGLLNAAASHLWDAFAATKAAPFSVLYWLVGLVVLAVALSFVGQWLIVVMFVLALAAVVASGVDVATAWRVTGISLAEWQRAVMLALVSTGLGLGIYWQNHLSKASQKRESTWVVLPIWFAQVVAGMMYALFQGVQGELSQLLYAGAAVVGAAVLLHYVRHNLASKAKGLLVAAGLLAAAVALWSLPDMTPMLVALVGVLGLFLCLLYALFAGWQMKISHLRKAIAFDSELTYNLWRVAVRIVIPLSILLASVGLVQTIV